MTRLIEVIAPLVWTQLWQVTLAIIAVGLITRLSCRRQPHLAYVLWLVVLAKCLTPPLWSSPTGVFSWTMPRLAVGSSEAPATPPTAPHPPSTGPSSVTAPSPVAAIEEVLPNAADSPPRESASATSARKNSPTAAAAAPVSTWRPTDFHVGPTLVWIWLAGVGVYAGFVLMATVACWRTIRMSRTAVDEELAGLLSDLRRRLGIRCGVRLFVVHEPLGPMTFGLFRPTVVIPQAIAEHSAEDLAPLLAHELVHVRRRDAFVGLLQVAVQCLWWFHPLVWWASLQIIRERERCCDEEVIAGLACEPGRYARCLLNVLELKRQLHGFRPCPGFAGSR